MERIKKILASFFTFVYNWSTFQLYSFGDWFKNASIKLSGAIETGFLTLCRWVFYVLFVVFSSSVFCGAFLYGAWTSSIVGKYLWLWYVVPTFGLKAITQPQAFGLSLLVGYWTYQHYAQLEKEDKEWKQHLLELAGILSYPWFVLLVGWVCHHFFM